MDIKIMMAAHKPYWMPKDDVYLPVQVGAAVFKRGRTILSKEV